MIPEPPESSMRVRPSSRSSAHVPSSSRQPPSRGRCAAPGMREVLVHIGQHYDENMSAVFFEELEMPPPDHHLGIGSGPHVAQTGQMLEAIEVVLGRDHSSWVLVYGDTNSTLASALAAARLYLPVAQVDAGLRSINRRMPEEINRVLTDHVSPIASRRPWRRSPTCAARAPQGPHPPGGGRHVRRGPLLRGTVRRAELRP